MRIFTARTFVSFFFRFSRMYKETAKEMEFMAKQQFTFENEVNATVLGKFTDFFQVSNIALNRGISILFVLIYCLITKLTSIMRPLMLNRNQDDSSRLKYKTEISIVVGIS